MKSINGYFVFHASRDHFVDTNMMEMMDRSEGKQESKKKFAELIDIDGVYNTVAFVHNVSSMDDVFELTNHIDQPWDFHPENQKKVRALNPFLNKRSTSVGDIILDAKKQKAYVVSGVGFKDLEIDQSNIEKLIDTSANLAKESLGKINGIEGLEP